MLAILIAAREHKGEKWCEKHGVGAVRHIVGAALPLAETVNASVGVYGDAQRATVKILEAECRRCRGCRLGRE